jgi:hypothetical protein
MRPFLDLVSYARHGPGRRDHFSRAELEIIARTVNRAPEVMVKVLTRGGQNLRAGILLSSRDGKWVAPADCLCGSMGGQ